MSAPSRALFLSLLCGVEGRTLRFCVCYVEIYAGEFLMWCVARDNRSRVFSGMGPGYYLVLSSAPNLFLAMIMLLSEFLRRL